MQTRSAAVAALPTRRSAALACVNAAPNMRLAYVHTWVALASLDVHIGQEALPDVPENMSVMIFPVVFQHR